MAISLLEEVKIQANVLVPVLRALREELGAERANALVTQALRDWARSVYERIGEQSDDAPRDKWGKHPACRPVDRCNASWKLTPRNSATLSMMSEEPLEQLTNYRANASRGLSQFFRRNNGTVPFLIVHGIK